MGYPVATMASDWLHDTLLVDGGPHVFGKYSKGTPFLFIYKKGKGKLIIGMSKDGGIY